MLRGIIILIILMSDDIPTPTTTTKRTFSHMNPDDDDQEDTTATSKRPRVVVMVDETAINSDDLRAATEVLDLDRVMKMLLQDLTATDKFFVAHPEEADRVATMLHRLNKNPVTVAMLQPDAQVPLKKFIATVAMRKWLDLDELGGKTYLLPLFVSDTELPEYRAWLQKESEEYVFGSLDTDLDTYTVVDAAFATNNVELLKWCRALRNKLGEEVFHDLYWQLEENDDDGNGNFVRLANDQTRAWWALNIGELPEESEDDDEKPEVEAKPEAEPIAEP